MKATHRITLCPHCTCTLNMHGSMSHEAPPSPGDVTICINCGEPCEFAENMTLKVPSKEALESLSPEDRMWLQKYKAHARQRKGEWK
jgi:hypothetical protein